MLEVARQAGAGRSRLRRGPDRGDRGGEAGLTAGQRRAADPQPARSRSSVSSCARRRTGTASSVRSACRLMREPSTAEARPELQPVAGEEPPEPGIVGVDRLHRRPVGVLGDPGPAGRAHDVPHEPGKILRPRLEEENVGFGVFAPVARQPVAHPRVERHAEDLVQNRREAALLQIAPSVRAGRFARREEAERDDRVDADRQPAALVEREGEVSRLTDAAVDVVDAADPDRFVEAGKRRTRRRRPSRSGRRRGRARRTWRPRRCRGRRRRCGGSSSASGSRSSGPDGRAIPRARTRVPRC